MLYYLKTDPIEKLSLSVRSSNALKRAKVMTIGALKMLSIDDLKQIRNMGAKSVSEIVDMLNGIAILDDGEDEIQISEPDREELEELASFIGADGEWYYDIELGELGLSNRSYNRLKAAGVDYASQMIGMTEDDLKSLSGLGAKSIFEILECISNLEFDEIKQHKKAGKDSASYDKEKRFLSALYQAVGKDFVLGDSSIRQAIDELCTKYLEEYDGESKADFIQRVMIPEICRDERVRGGLETLAISNISGDSMGVSEDEILSSLPEAFRRAPVIRWLLEDNKLYITTDGLYRLVLPTIHERIKMIQDERVRFVLEQRIIGKTLEEVGAYLDITRERVRQIEAKTIRMIHKTSFVAEDKYAQAFQKYNMTAEEFMLGFSEIQDTFDYLSMTYSHGDRPISELMEDTEFPPSYRRAAEKVVYKDYITIGRSRVLCQRADLCEYVLRSAGKEGLSFNDLKSRYYSLLDDLGLRDDPKLQLSDHGYENKFAASRHVLWRFKRRMRYYNIDAYDYSELFAVLDFERYREVNVAYSTYKFFRDHPETMKAYEIQDEYELHNLLKKLDISGRFPFIKLSKMPMLIFGDADRDVQAKKLLLALAPVSNTDLAAAFEDQYGVRATTALANWFNGIEQYFHDGMYRIDHEAPSQIILDELRAKLKDDMYFIDRVTEIYEELFPDADTKLINPYTLKLLGFKVYSDYVIRDTYAGASDYFRKTLVSAKTVSISDFPDGVTSLPTFTSVMYKLRADYDIIEYEPQKYLNCSCLLEEGIEKKDLVGFCDHIARVTVNGQFFTIHQLQNHGVEDELYALGFDEWFYASLLAEDTVRFSCRRMGGNRLFRRGTGDVTLVDFLESLVFEQEDLSIDIYDLIQCLRDEYGINLGKSKIMEIVKGSTMYYDSIYERVYADYDVYFESIE